MFFITELAAIMLDLSDSENSFHCLLIHLSKKKLLSLASVFGFPQ